jgi:hypothetical protein
MFTGYKCGNKSKLLPLNSETGYTFTVFVTLVDFGVTMAENDSLRKTLDHYLQQKRDKLDEVRQLDLIISRLSRDLGEAASEPQSSESLGISTDDNRQETAEVPTSSSGGANVRPDAFFGMTYTTAAKTYLEKVNHAVSMDELLAALNRGGCPVGGREPKKTLYISLIRDVRNFVNIPGKSGFLGLRKFYPNLKAAKDKNDDRETPTKRKKRRKKRKAKTAEDKSGPTQE